MTWRVWTDGSCQHGAAESPRGVGGWGGWAAVVEHGSDRFALRGRVPDTTNTRMELRAAIEGLRAVPAGREAVLHTDCTTVVAVYWGWRDGTLARPLRGPDARFWLELDAELERVGRARVVLLGKGQRDPVHRRAHAIAGAEARAGLRGIEPNAVPLEDAHRLRKHLQKAARRSVPARGDARPLRHLAACQPGLCVSSCPVWFARSAEDSRQGHAAPR